MAYPNLIAPLTGYPASALTSALPADYTPGQQFSISPAGWFEVDAAGDQTTNPLGQSGPFEVLIGSENVLCSSVTAGGLVTVWSDLDGSNGRGNNSTTAAAHAAGAALTLSRTSAQDAPSTTASASSTVSTQAFGDSPLAGSSGNWSKGDHKHGFPSLIAQGTVRVIAKAFDHTTAGLATGAALYTPTIGDQLIQAWVEFDTAFDGTTPKADFGAFIGGSTSGLAAKYASVLDATVVSPAVTNNTNVVSHASVGLPIGLEFATADPIKVIINQTGAVGGAASSPTVGSGQLYLLVATPAAA